MRKTGCDWEKLLHHITPFPRNKLFICGRLVGKQMFSIMQSNCSSKHIFTQCLMNIPDLTSTLGHRLYSHLNINTNFSVLIRNSTFILSRTEAVYNRHVSCFLLKFHGSFLCGVRQKHSEEYYHY